MVRCTKCRFLLEPPTRGLLPDCPQCGRATMAVLKIEPSDDVPHSQPTYKFSVVKTDSAAR